MDKTELDQPGFKTIRDWTIGLLQLYRGELEEIVVIPAHRGHFSEEAIRERLEKPDLFTITREGDELIIRKAQ